VGSPAPEAGVTTAIRRGAGAAGTEPGTRTDWVRVGLLGCSLAAVLFTVASVVHPPLDVVSPGLRGQVNWLVRLAGALSTATALLFLPGWALRHRLGWFRGLQLAFLPLPGLLLTAALGGLLWITASRVEPQGTAAAVVGLVVLVCAGLLGLPARDRDRDRAPGGSRALRLPVVAAVPLFVAAAVGRSLWSQDTTGSLYAGTISRTLEVGDRSDSRISYHVVQLIANGIDPHSPQGAANFLPWSFSDRGPLAALFSSVSVLASGAHPPVALPDMPWTPFDIEGFGAYRMAMIVLASTVLIPAYALLERLRGERGGAIALLLLAGTPFVVHEAWFTWPKLLTTALVLMAAAALENRRWVSAGLLVGLGYLCHPLALFAVPALAGWVLLRHQDLRSPVRVLGPGVRALAGLLVPLALWRIVNAGSKGQGAFFTYASLADGVTATGPGDWLWSRVESLSNTLIPFSIPLFSADNRSVNVAGGQSPGVVHVFFGYWNALPFALGLLALPVVVRALWRFTREQRGYAAVLIAVPLVLFAAYWGFSVTGLLREGLHPWLVTVVLAIAWTVSGPAWTQGRLTRVLLAVRPLEALGAMTIPVLATSGTVLATGAFRTSDVVAWCLMVGGTAGLALATWRVLDPAALAPDRGDEPDARPPASGESRPRQGAAGPAQRHPARMS
jgi:hypothetical protein